MLYLLTQGWQWFAGALALGALVGWLTTSRSRDAAFSGGWIVLAAAFVLGAAGVISALGVFDGREAVAFDVALLAGIAYFVGLPLGGGMKMTAPAPTAQVKKPPVVVLRGHAPGRAEDPIIVPPPAQPVAIETAPNGVDHGAGAAAPLDVAAHPAAKSKRAGASNGKAEPGAPPESLSAPRGGAPDDLSKIRGLGPKSVEKLHALGVYHYDQIAGWSHDNAKWVGARLGVAGRVESGRWVQQARELSDRPDGRA